MIFITLSAAKINDESKRPIQVMRDIPHDHYHQEVTVILLGNLNYIKFKIYIIGSAFSGTSSKQRSGLDWNEILLFKAKHALKCKRLIFWFFFFNLILMFIRKLQVAGTIVTYELVLIQFQVKISQSEPTPC